MKFFDAKTFNPEAFGKYMAELEKLRGNKLLNSGAIYSNRITKNVLQSQVGGHLATFPMHGRISGNTVNYDGQTDIKANKTGTFAHSKVVTGRAAAFVELDFSQDITGGEKFIDAVGRQLADYWDDIDEDILLAVLEGIFKMTGAKNKEFVDKHTYEVEEPIGPTTLNTGMQKALGDVKDKFKLAIMHSAVATRLENIEILEYLKYTDKNGIERPTGLATLNGRLVLIDDNVPVDGDKYTTYILGTNAIEVTDVGVAVPYEMDRDPKVNGGEDTLYTRQRKVYAPNGISFTAKNMASLSPTNEELADGANWELVKGEKDVINHRHVAIARIISPVEELKITPDVKG